VTPPTTRFDPAFGHQVLDPMPTADELEAFYRDTYYRLIDEGRLAVNIARERKGGAEADDQARWFKETLHRDVIDLLKQHAPGRDVLEVGCGLGVLLDHLAEEGFSPSGLDLATAAVETVRKKGFPAFASSFETSIENGIITANAYDSVLFIEILEQTFNPLAHLQTAFEALRPGGVVIIRSANSFNALQLTAHERLGMPRWWVSRPQHVHYLTYESTDRLLHKAGFEAISWQSDFPMELFILMGFNYVEDPALGAECHKRRVMLERALPVEVRRRLYRAFAEAGIGRCMLVCAKKPA
jgi:2-polyprenyl-3-methyl-5-hydroxy-6-metoxy-1,4-benzoquinol methylase